jgi:hypothetical protein
MKTEAASDITTNGPQGNQAERGEGGSHVEGFRGRLNTRDATPRPPHVGTARLYQRRYDAAKVVEKIYRPAVLAVLGIVVASFLLSLPSLTFSHAHRLCSIPAVSPAIPFCHLDAPKHQITSSSGQLTYRADYPRLIALQMEMFNRLLEENAGNGGLALGAKRVEMISHDLISLVEVSYLRNKDEITGRLGQLGKEAKETGRSLRVLFEKIRGAADS